MQPIPYTQMTSPPTMTTPSPPSLREARPVLKFPCKEIAVQETHPRWTRREQTDCYRLGIAATNGTQDLRCRSVERRSTHHPLRIRNVSPDRSHTTTTRYRIIPHTSLDQPIRQPLLLVNSKPAITTIVGTLTPLETGTPRSLTLAT